MDHEKYERPNPFAPLQHPRVDLSIKLQDPPRSGGDRLVSALLVLDQVPEEIFLHSPWLPSTHFSDGIDPRSNDFTPNTRMNELSREFLDDGGQSIWRGEVVYALCECDEDGGDAQLMIREVFEDVGVEGEN